MATIKKSQSGNTLKRIIDVEFISSSHIFEEICAGRSLPTEEVLVNNKPINFLLKPPRGLDLQQENWSAKDEALLAVALRDSLSDARIANPGLLNDHGVWAWIALEQLRSYVVNRWCGGFDSANHPVKPSGCNYFLTGDGVHAQSRCAPRRIYIAAETSFRADGNSKTVEKFIEKSDIFSSIFERKLGLDPELAVEMVQVFYATKATRETYRKATKLIGLVLGTTCLEALDRQEKKQLVEEAMDEVSTSLIDDD
jgi:hypothetical protein